LLTIAGFYFGITTTEWLSNNGYRSDNGIEGLNTAVEKIADFIHPVMKKSVYHLLLPGGSFAANTIIISLIIYIQNFIGICLIKNGENRTFRQKN
jgi:diacylglycerol kinase (ATP)